MQTNTLHLTKRANVQAAALLHKQREDATAREALAEAFAREYAERRTAALLRKPRDVLELLSLDPEARPQPIAACASRGRIHTLTYSYGVHITFR